MAVLLGSKTEKKFRKKKEVDFDIKIAIGANYIWLKCKAKCNRNLTYNTNGIRLFFLAFWFSKKSRGGLSGYNHRHRHFHQHHHHGSSLVVEGKLRK